MFYIIGNKTIDVDKISTFNLNYCPRPPKTKWVRRLKELMSTDVNVERLGDEFPVLLFEVCESILKVRKAAMIRKSMQSGTTPDSGYHMGK